MPDTPVKKSILRLIREGLQKLLHILLIPFVAALKALIAGLTYIHDELARV